MHKQVSLKLIRDHSSSQNTQLRLKKSHKNDHQIFISKQQRFPVIKTIHDQNPGPGSYLDPLARSRQIEIQKQQNSNRNYQHNHLDSFISRQHQWIFGSDRLKFSNTGSGLGPGAYEIVAKNMQKSLSPNSWGKSQRFDGTQWGQSQSSVGPGAYNLQKTSLIPRKKQMGIFKSKSPKTFLQKIQKDIEKNSTNKNQSSTNFEPFDNEELQQLQKLVQTNENQTKVKKMDPVFLSRSKRYELINPENGSIGPGSYELQLNYFGKTKTKKVKSVSISHNYIRKKDNSIGNDLKAPGPTSYNIEKFNIQKQIQKRISSLKGNMALQTRWKNNWKKAAQTIPGPGHYNKQKYVFINQKQYEHKPLVSHHQKIDIPFLSSSSRIIQQGKQVSSPFGQYNLNQFDMSQKMRKKKSHIEKLKAMDISVPGFQSSQRRTTFNLGKLLKGLGSKIEGGNLVRVKSNSSLYRQQK